MICPSTNWRTISVIAFWSSVFSEYCGVASAVPSVPLARVGGARRIPALWLGAGGDGLEDAVVLAGPLLGLAGWLGALLLEARRPVLARSEARWRPPVRGHDRRRRGGLLRLEARLGHLHP